MGNLCPSGFERGPNETCHATCPGMFKYNSETPVERCVYATNNRYSFPLTGLPPPPKGGKVPPEYKAERQRVDNEAKRVREQMLTNAPVDEVISTYKDVRKETEQQHSSLKSQYASYTSMKEASDAIQSVTQALKPMRPPTAPADDVNKERNGILRGSGPNFLLFQIALVILLICLLVYVFIPAQYAHGIAFLLLSVGIAVGIFLTK